MKPYRVAGGTVAIPAGELVGLTRAQVEGRERPADPFDRDVAAGRPAAKPAVVERGQKLGRIYLCKTLAPLELAKGETVHLTTAPPQALADRLRPVGHDDGMVRVPIAQEKQSAMAAAGGATESVPASRVRGKR